MSNPLHQNGIAERLGRFAGQVDNIVHRNNGFLIYAGGDDVLALITLDDALRCASEIRACYGQCFRGSGVATSISAAIGYVHIKVPLGKVLGDVHQLLDDVAKEQTGRDAVAVRIWKPGGMAAEWTMPWESALDSTGSTVRVDRLAGDFRTREGEALGMSSKFFYGIREHFDMLTPRDGKDGLLNDNLALELLSMQFLNSGFNRGKWNRAKAREQIAPLLDQCRRRVRVRDDKERISTETRPGLHVDAALLVRFLAQKGLDR